MRFATVFLGAIALLPSGPALADAPAPAAAAPFVRGASCTLPWQLELDPQPLGPGPLSAKAVYCADGSHYHHQPGVSPNGERYAIFGEPRGVLKMANLGGEEPPASYDSGVAFEEWARGTDPLVRWSSDSQFLWGARQDRMKPAGGWMLTPLQPVRIALDGQATDLPPLTHPAGTLDALLWAGGDGVALAQFGTKGDYYRPKRDNPAPTYAIVDAAAGKVLADLPIYDLDPLLDPKRYQNSKWLTRHALATRLPDGRVRALLDFFGSWILWTQGDPPKAIPALPVARAYTLSPDGKAILLTQPESPNDVFIIVSDCGRSGIPCEPRHPRALPLVSLRDVATGREIWSLSGAFDPRDEFPEGAISPDNRFALVGQAPPEIVESEEQSMLYSTRRTIALVSLADGQVLQTIQAPTGTYAMGFAEGGKAVWVQNVNTVTLYRLDAATGAN